MNNAEKNKELAERLGLKWIDLPTVPISRLSKDINPDFTTDPVSLLREMQKKGYLQAALSYISDRDFISRYSFPVRWFVEDLLLDQTGKLADLVLEWLRKEEVK